MTTYSMIPTYLFNNREYKTTRGLFAAALKSNPVAVNCGFDEQGRFYVEGKQGARLYYSTLRSKHFPYHICINS